jgi:hypothetical protein
VVAKCCGRLKKMKRKKGKEKRTGKEYFVVEAYD